MQSTASLTPQASADGLASESSKHGGLAGEHVPQSTSLRLQHGNLFQAAAARTWPVAVWGPNPHGLMKKLPPASSTAPPYIRSRAGSPLSKQKEELCVLRRKSRHRHIRSFPVFSVGLGLVCRRGRPSGRGV